MSDDTGTFRTDIEIASVTQQDTRVRIANDGRIIERPIGWAAIYAGGRSTVAVVVFAKPGEMSLLGTHGLEGMNLRIDLVRRELIPAGPVPVAVAA